MPPPNMPATRGAGALQGRHRQGRHRGGRHAVPRGPFPPDPSRPARTPRHLRRDDLHGLRQRGGQADPARPLRHEQAGQRTDGAAEEAARQQGEGGTGRRGADEDAAAHSADAAFHPRHRPGCAGLFHDDAVLAGRLRREHAQPGASRRRSRRRRSAPGPARAGQGHTPGGVSRGRRLPPAHAGAAVRRSICTADAASVIDAARHRRHPAAALVPVVQQRRPLRRRDRGARGPRPARDPGLRRGARFATRRSTSSS